MPKYVGYSNKMNKRNMGMSQGTNSPMHSGNMNDMIASMPSGAPMPHINNMDLSRDMEYVSGGMTSKNKKAKNSRHMMY